MVPATPSQPSADIDAATRRLMAALDALESAVERRREADRDENELASRIQALGADRSRLADELDGSLVKSRRLERANREIAERLDAAIGTIRAVLDDGETRRDSMSHINVTINGRQYRMACEEGQEVRLLKLAESLESRVESAARQVRRDRRCAADRDGGAHGVRRIARRQSTHPRARGGTGGACATSASPRRDRAKATQTAVANALNAAADRIEKTTQVLNRTIGGGVAIG